MHISHCDAKYAEIDDCSEVSRKSAGRVAFRCRSRDGDPRRNRIVRFPSQSAFSYDQCFGMRTAGWWCLDSKARNRIHVDDRGAAWRHSILLTDIRQSPMCLPSSDCVSNARRRNCLNLLATAEFLSGLSSLISMHHIASILVLHVYPISCRRDDKVAVLVFLLWHRLMPVYSTLKAPLKGHRMAIV